MKVQVESCLPAVALSVGISGAVLNLVDSHLLIIALVKPVLGAGMAVVEDDGRKTGDGVGGVSDAVFGAGLLGDELGKSRVANSRTAICDQLGSNSALAEVASRNSTNSGTEGVAGDGDAVGRVGDLGFPDECKGTGSNLEVGCVKAGVHKTSKS